MLPSPPAHSWREIFLLLSFVLDGMVAASGMSVIVLQGKEVHFPNAAYVAAFQLCYIIPQVVTTPLAERLCAKLSARNVLLPLTLAGSLAVAYVILLSLSTHSLPLFFAARLMGGVLRHPKILFARALAEDGGSASSGRVQAMVPNAMHLGLVVSAALGDMWQHAVPTQRFFVYAEVVAIALVGIAAFMAPPESRGSPPAAAPPSAPALSRQAVAALTTGGGVGSSQVWAGLATFVALRLAAGVNQCVYALAGPGFGVSYLMTALHLVAQDRVIPRLASVVTRRATTKSAQRAALVTAAAALVAGVWAAPAVQAMGPWVYYPVTLALVDVPTAVANAQLVEAVRSVVGCPEAVKAGIDAGLLVYVAIVVKMFSAPVRMTAAMMLQSHKYAIRVVAVPAAVHVLGVALSDRFGVGAVVAVACASALVSL